MRLNLRQIASLLGLLLSFNAAFMLLCLPFSFYYGEDPMPFILAAGAIAAIGVPTWIIAGKTENRALTKRDGYLIVTGGYLVMSFSGTIPYVLSGAIPQYSFAIFETISGYTATGATILDNIESLPHGILFWRSLTQWIGGMGIVVLTIAVLPTFGIGGLQLFIAEAPGISADKLKPRIKDTAKRLWLLYLGFTVAELLLLMVGGMGFFDAINHSLTTMASGGFSTKQDSIAYFQSPFIQYVIIGFMIVAGSNFTILYFLLKGQFRKLISNEEYRYYLLFLMFFALVVFIPLLSVLPNSVEEIFRTSLFQVVSIITTTGYATADYTTWGPFLLLVFFAMMFIGGSAGSTSGGVKIVRHIILFKNSFLEMNRLLHPSAVIPVRLNKKAVERTVTYNILAFIMIYILTFAVGTLVMAWLGTDFKTAFGSVAATLGNVGPGIGDVGPAQSYASIPSSGKWFLSFLMLIGRLELFTVLILFSIYFWRKQ